MLKSTPETIMKCSEKTFGKKTRKSYEGGTERNVDGAEIAPLPVGEVGKNEEKNDNPETSAADKDDDDVDDEDDDDEDTGKSVAEEVDGVAENTQADESTEAVNDECFDPAGDDEESLGSEKLLSRCCR